MNAPPAPATGSTAWLDVYPKRPGAPLVLPGATLAEAFGITAPLPCKPLPAPLAETLDLLARGMTDEQIGKALGMSPDGAHNRRRRLYRHLGVHNRAGAVYAAAGLGLLAAPPAPSADAARGRRP